LNAGKMAYFREKRRLHQLILVLIEWPLHGFWVERGTSNTFARISCVLAMLTAPTVLRDTTRD
jgi:hypothetical protein